MLRPKAEAYYWFLQPGKVRQMNEKQYKRQIKLLKEENELLKNIISEFDKSTKKMLSFLNITKTEQTEETGRAEILQSKFNNTLPENEL